MEVRLYLYISYQMMRLTHRGGAQRRDVQCEPQSPILPYDLPPGPHLPCEICFGNHVRHAVHQLAPDAGNNILLIQDQPPPDIMSNITRYDQCYRRQCSSGDALRHANRMLHFCISPPPLSTQASKAKGTANAACRDSLGLVSRPGARAYA